MLRVISGLGLVLVLAAGGVALSHSASTEQLVRRPAGVVVRTVGLELVDNGRCFVVHGVRVKPICRIDRPLLVFRKGHEIVGLTSRRVAAVVAGGYAVARFPVRGGFAFDVELPQLTELSARDRRGRVLARYCASALRGVCGISAQRRS